MPICVVLIGQGVCLQRAIKIQKISDLNHENGRLGTYKALLIGIKDYKDSKIPDL